MRPGGLLPAAIFWQAERRYGSTQAVAALLIYLPS